jgi:hypothetical protein
LITLVLVKWLNSSFRGRQNRLKCFSGYTATC